MHDLFGSREDSHASRESQDSDNIGFPSSELGSIIQVSGCVFRQVDDLTMASLELSQSHNQPVAIVSLFIVFAYFPRKHDRRDRDRARVDAPTNGNITFFIKMSGPA